MKKKPMVRKQLYIKAEQDQVLRERAQEYGSSEGKIVRDALQAYLKAPVYSEEVELSAWEEEMQFITARVRDTDGAGSKRTWKRADIYEY